MGGDLRLFKLHHLGGESSQISCCRIYDLLYGNCHGDSIWSRKVDRKNRDLEQSQLLEGTHHNFYEGKNLSCTFEQVSNNLILNLILF